MAFEAAPCHAQHELTLNFFAGPNTTKAIDAFAHIAGHVRVAEVFLSVKVGFAFGITHFAHTYFGCHFLQFAVVVYLAGEAIQRMVC
jgi:hypothetical protein